MTTFSTVVLCVAYCISVGIFAAKKVWNNDVVINWDKQDVQNAYIKYSKDSLAETNGKNSFNSKAFENFSRTMLNQLGFNLRKEELWERLQQRQKFEEELFMKKAEQINLGVDFDHNQSEAAHSSQNSAAHNTNSININWKAGNVKKAFEKYKADSKGNVSMNSKAFHNFANALDKGKYLNREELFNLLKEKMNNPGTAKKT